MSKYLRVVIAVGLVPNHRFLAGTGVVSFARVANRTKGVVAPCGRSQGRVSRLLGLAVRAHRKASKVSSLGGDEVVAIWFPSPCFAICTSDEIMARDSVRWHDLSLCIDAGLLLVRHRACLTGAAPLINLPLIHAEG
jgi:hypothetical protein